MSSRAPVRYEGVKTKVSQRPRPGQMQCVDQECGEIWQLPMNGARKAAGTTVCPGCGLLQKVR